MRCLDTLRAYAVLLCGLALQTRPITPKSRWKDLCYPKSEGGLGVRQLRDYVRVFVFSLIGTCSLWVSWVQHYIWGHSSFWDIRDETTGSWI